MGRVKSSFELWLAMMGQMLYNISIRGGIQQITRLICAGHLILSYRKRDYYGRLYSQLLLNG